MTELSPARRNVWFGCSFFALSLNAAAGTAVSTIRLEGLAAAAFALFGISAILWSAILAGSALLFEREADGGEALSSGDRIALVASLAAIMVPAAGASAIALTGLSGWAMIRSRHRSALCRAGGIFLAVAGSLLWGRLVLQAGGDTLLSLDGRAVGWLAGTGGFGNLVRFAGHAGWFYVAPGCSSLQGVSLAVVLWATLTRYYDLPFDARSAGALIGAVAGAILANLLRLAAIATWPAHFELLHVGWGATAFGWLALALILAANLIGLRDAILARS